jgi:hypothetical protein
MVLDKTVANWKHYASFEIFHTIFTAYVVSPSIFEGLQNNGHRELVHNLPPTPPLPNTHKYRPTHVISFYEISTEVIFQTEKKRLGNIFEARRFIFRGNKKIDVKAAEEYCWTIPQWEGFKTVMLLPIRLRLCEFQLDSNLYTQVFDHMCSQFRLAQNSTCARPSATSLLSMAERVNTLCCAITETQHDNIYTRIPKLEFSVKYCIRKRFTVCTP